MTRNHDAHLRALERRAAADPEAPRGALEAARGRALPPLPDGEITGWEVVMMADSEIKFERTNRTAGTLYLMESDIPRPCACRRCRARARYHRAQARR